MNLNFARFSTSKIGAKMEYEPGIHKLKNTKGSNQQLDSTVGLPNAT